MAYSNKIRINIAVEPELDERIVKLSKRLNMSKTALCSFLISQSISNYEKAWEMLDNPQTMMQMLAMFAPDVDSKKVFDNFNAIVEKEKNETIE